MVGTMCMRLFYIGIIIFLFPRVLSGQAMDNTLAFRNISSDHYFRINYENDYFTATDRDYTQGIYIEWVTPRLRHFPLTALLWHPRNGIIKYGLAIEDDTYTPNHYERPEIQYGDRPFADALFLKSFLVSVNEDRRERIGTQVSIGVIGPAAGGEGMQEGIHRWLHDIQPKGWANQIKNGPVLNYQVNYEKELYADRDQFSLSSYNSLRIGTLSDKASTGLTGMVGNFYSPFAGDRGLTARGHRPRLKKVQYYFYDQLSVNFIGYDATLQGSLFDHSSPYTIPGGELNRLTAQNRWGFVLILKKLYLEYYQTGLTEEFHTSVYHRTGGIQVGFGF
jgi:lipid A 3-O-deacylase